MKRLFLFTVQGKKLIYVEELPVKDHYAFYCEDQGRGKTFVMGKLLGEALGHPALWKFPLLEVGGVGSSDTLEPGV